MDRQFSLIVVLVFVAVAYLAGAKFPMLAQRVGIA